MIGLCQNPIYKDWIVRLTSLAILASWAVFQPNEFATGQQLQPDSTLGVESSIVNSGTVINGLSSELITGGAVRGANLFHSFKEFSIGDSQSVYFNNPIGTERIITRVTGSNRSEILGKLGVLGGNADLFLINPNGLIFGSNSTLDLNGSFFATAASSLIFPDIEYIAVDAFSSSLLSTNIPIGLQFRVNNGGIINQSIAVGIASGGLQVNPGKTIALVGSNILIDQGFILSFGGHVELGSVTSGQVSLNLVDQKWTLGYENIQPQNFGDINLRQASTISTSLFGFPGEDIGSIYLQGQNIKISNGSRLFALSFSDVNPGGTIKISASNTFELSGINSKNNIRSNLSTSSLGRENGGNVIIDAKSVFLRDRAFIQTSSSGIETSPGVFDVSNGKAGNVIVETTQLEISGGAFITASTIGSGEGGVISTNASDYINIFGVSPDNGQPSGLFTISEGGSNGTAGNIQINTRLLKVADSAEINASSKTDGAAGNITINARTFRLENQGLISSQTSGGFGNIAINSNDIILRGNSNISTNASGAAAGGNINISTGVLAALENSDITANSEEDFGGRVSILAKGIFGIKFRNDLTPGNDITSSSKLGPNFSGKVEIDITGIDPDHGLFQLPSTVIDPSTLVAQNPCKHSVGSEFVRSGRGGLPPSISQDFDSNSSRVDLVQPIVHSAEKVESKPVSKVVNSQIPTLLKIVPAQGWIYNDKGQAVLVAYNPSISGPQRSQPTPASCPAF